jgi:hypothetical protein
VNGLERFTYKGQYIVLHELHFNDEDGEGYILGIGCSMGTDLSKDSFQFVMDNYVGRPNSTIYNSKEEFDVVFKSAKELLEKDYKVFIDT